MSDIRLYQSEKGCDYAADMLKALGHPIRLQIVAILCQREATVSDLSHVLNVSQPVVSQQLRILRMRSLVSAIRDKGFSRYRIKEPQLINMICCLETCANTHGKA